MVNKQLFLSARRVEANIKAQLVLTGTEDKTADSTAKVFAAHILRSANKMGMSPEQYAQMFANVKFVRGTDAKGNGVIYFEPVNAGVDLNSKVTPVYAQKTIAKEQADIIHKNKNKKAFEKTIAGKYTNTDTGWDVNLSQTNVSHAIATLLQASWIDRTTGINIIASLPEIIQNAKLVETHSDLKHNDPATAKIHRMFAAVQLDGDTDYYTVKLTVKQLVDRYEASVEGIYRAHTAEIVDKKNPDLSSPGKPKQGDTGTSAASGNLQITLADLLKNVKDNDDNPYIQTLFQDAVPADVTSDSFKAWFGDWQNNHGKASKVVDKDGRPLIVYHGTNSDFAIYLGSKITNTSEGAGFYFSPDNQLAGSFGSRVVAAYLNLRNPVDPYSELDIDSPRDAIHDVISRLEDMGYKFYSQVEKDLVDVYADSYEAQELLDGLLFLKDFINDEEDNIDADKIYSDIRKAEMEVFGVDGYYSSNYGGSPAYVAWLSSQIKSIDNLGTFNPGNDNIFFQSVGHVSKALFDAFDHSFMGTGEGAQVYGWGTYAAMNQKVLDWYLKQFTRANASITFRGKEYDTIPQYSGLSSNETDLLRGIIKSEWELGDLSEHSFQNDISMALKEKIDKAKRYAPFPGANDELIKRCYNVLNWLDTFGKEFNIHKGNPHQYEVEIPDVVKGENYLDWDNEVSEGQLARIFEGLKGKGSIANLRYALLNGNKVDITRVLKADDLLSYFSRADKAKILKSKYNNVLLDLVSDWHLAANHIDYTENIGSSRNFGGWDRNELYKGEKINFVSVAISDPLGNLYFVV